ncbi:response regulator [Caballeronia sp. SEWSISQ10-4 2]|uniref:hybrid sensor histidine kinase/response regulator n=1 Tax=Caballeronia sp. SEWSISQ10-4 2 TaxID=2937438 RepID=UPI00264AA286|nr:response regulator [Caballeronia sp. SEWSISQ10-4 2]MDN7183989.1 response regulator [Caballeronia sp. SEWSISQ10-4 2]
MSETAIDLAAATMEPPAVLIVDDTPANLSVVVESLEGQGFRVLVALDGLEALERAAFSQPDLILLDVKMPGIDGYETCRRLKSNSDTSDIPVIFMTSMSATADVVEGLAAGGVDYVTKPIRVDEVVARIGTHLALRTLQQQLVTRNMQLQHEIAEREKTQQALSDARDELEARVAQRTEELARANVSLNLEIVERRGVEARLKESEARFRAIVETSPVPLCITSMPEGDILYMNQPLRELFALDATRPPVGNIVDFYASPQERDELVHHLRDDGNLRNAELRFRRPDGTSFWAVANARVATYGDVPAIYVGLYDVTARRKADEKLRASEASLANAQRLARLGDWAWDRDGGITHWSSELYRILGLEPSVAKPCYSAYLAVVHPDDHAVVRRAMRVLLSRGQSFGIDHRIVGPDGSTRIVRLQAELVDARDGQSWGIVGTVQDITERKRTEEELLASREQLRELSAYLEAIREEERRRIALEIHDELGQLLTALKMDVALLKMRVVPDAEATRKIDDIRELVEKTIWMVRNVASHLRPAALNFGIVSALEWLAEDFSRRNGMPCQLVVRGGEPSLADAHATAVFRIVQESLTNVSRHAGASRVAVTLVSSDVALDLRVSDDGQGFDMELAQDGYSYGLLGMSERARLIGGTLQIDSAPGAGTMVSINLPLDGGREQ